MSEPFPLEPLDEMNRPLREGFARIAAERNQDAPRDGSDFDTALKVLDRVSSFAGVAMVRAMLIDLQNQNSGYKAENDMLRLENARLGEEIQIAGRINAGLRKELAGRPQ